MTEKVCKDKEACFICDGEVPIDKKGYFLGVKDNHCRSQPLCKICSKIWDNYLELLDADKSNFYEYTDIIKNFIKRNKLQSEEKAHHE